MMDLVQEITGLISGFSPVEPRVYSSADGIASSRRPKDARHERVSIMTYHGDGLQHWRVCGGVDMQFSRDRREAPMPKEPRKTLEDEEREALDRELDEELDDTFPASDPPKVTRVPRRSRIIDDEDGPGDGPGERTGNG
jgi:hypothetical protein